jgi:hypothetical protein
MPSHSAILAKSPGLPTVRTDDREALQDMSGDDVLIDATKGHRAQKKSGAALLRNDPATEKPKLAFGFRRRQPRLSSPKRAGCSSSSVGLVQL